MNSLLQRRIAAVLLFIAAAIAILLPFASATLLTIALGGGLPVPQALANYCVLAVKRACRAKCFEASVACSISQLLFGF